MTNKEALVKLKELSSHLDDVEYSDIIGILKESIRKIPIPIAKLAANTPIDRVRKNIGESLFTNVHEQLSYIKDQYVIDNFLREFGRANEPHQPMFYGAIESSQIGHQRITALAETSELFQDPNAVNLDGELYTVSRWRNSIELSLAEVVFSSEAIKINPNTKKAFEKQSEFAKNLQIDDIDFYIDFLVFISDQFARPKNSHHDYKISTAYANLVLTHPDIHGVAYPSVQTQYMGQNIVFPAKTVDSFLAIGPLATQRLFKNKMRTVINNHMNCVNPSECLTNILWVPVKSQFVKTLDEIHKALNSE